MSEDLVAVFTGKSLANGMSEDGGSGHWIARKHRVLAATYLLCVRNRRETWAETDVEHGTAFLVARISGTTPSEHQNRLVINFSEYAEIHAPSAWHLCTDGQRYPVAYLDSGTVQNTLGLDFEALEWKPFSPTAESAAVATKATRSVTPGDITRTAIQEAKAMLSDALGVPEESIEITVRY
jgi:hypothetical protein